MDRRNARPDSSVESSRGETRDLQGVVWILQARGTHQRKLLIILESQASRVTASATPRSGWRQYASSYIRCKTSSVNMPAPISLSNGRIKAMSSIASRRTTPWYCSTGTLHSMPAAYRPVRLSARPSDISTVPHDLASAVSHLPSGSTVPIRLCPRVPWKTIGAVPPPPAPLDGEGFCNPDSNQARQHVPAQHIDREQAPKYRAWLLGGEVQESGAIEWRQ